MLRKRARQLVNETSEELHHAKSGKYELGSLAHKLYELADLADKRPFDHDIRRSEAMGAASAIHRYGEARDFVALERWGGRLIALAENPAFRDDHDIRLHEAEGAVNAINHYGNTNASFEPKRRAWWLTLANVAPEFPAHAGIQNAANLYGLTFGAQAAKGWPYGAPSASKPQKP